MPGLSGAFVQRVVTAFLHAHSGTYCYVEARSSEWITESLVGRRLDVGLLSARMQNPFVESEMLGEHALVCIMPAGHPLAARRVIVPADFASIPLTPSRTPTALTPRANTRRRLAPSRNCF